MIQYSIDTDIRTKVVFGLAITAILIAGFLATHLPAWFVAPSSMAVFGGLYLGFDKWAWKLPPVQNIHGVTDLNGIWSGTLDRKNAETGLDETDVAITVHISQTWSKIEVNLVNDNLPDKGMPGRTRSTASTAFFKTESTHSKLLRYIYSFGQGYGVAELQLSGQHDSLQLKGDYISSEMNKGYICIERET